MAYYVDTGDGRFTECDTLQHAREVAQHALQAAQAFKDRMGFVPFWGRCVEIRKGSGGILIPHAGKGVECLNQIIVAATRTHGVLCIK